MHIFFWGGDEFSDGGFSTGRTFLGEGSFQEVEFFSGDFTLWEFTRIPIKILLMFCFLSADSVLRVEMLRAIAQGKFSPGLNCLEGMSVEKRDFSVDVEFFFSTNSKEQN